MSEQEMKIQLGELQRRVECLEVLFDLLDSPAMPSKPRETDSLTEAFDIARKLYPGTKRGLKTEFDNFKKKHKDWREVVPQLEGIVQQQIDYKRSLVSAKKFCPEWKNFSTWVNNRWWEAELPAIETKAVQRKQQFKKCRFCGARLNSGETYTMTCLRCEYKRKMELEKGV
jgi:hypothetical protein